MEVEMMANVQNSGPCATSSRGKDLPSVSQRRNGHLEYTQAFCPQSEGCQRMLFQEKAGRCALVSAEGIGLKFFFGTIWIDMNVLAA